MSKFYVRLATLDDEKEVMQLYEDHYDETYELFKRWRNIKWFFNQDPTVELYVCVETITNRIVGAVTHRYIIKDSNLHARSNCGLTHKNYRLKGLSKMRRNFALKRYWEKNVDVAVRIRKVGTRHIDADKELSRGWSTNWWTDDQKNLHAIMKADPKTLKLEE